MNHAQKSLTRHLLSPLLKSTLTQTKECRKITFRTHQKLNSWKDANTIQISIYLSWILWKRPSISLSSLSQNSPEEELELGEKGFSLFEFKFWKCNKCFGRDSTLKILRSMMLVKNTSKKPSLFSQSSTRKIP